MAEVIQVSSLQIDQHLSFQKRMWAIQRIGWGVMAVVLVAAVLGLFGNGLFSERTTASPSDDVRVRHERFARRLAPVELDLHLSNLRPPEVRVWVSRDWLDGLQIERIEPEPARVESAGDRVVYTIALAEPTRGTRVRIFAKPIVTGSRGGTVGVVGGESVSIRQFVYP